MARSIMARSIHWISPGVVLLAAAAWLITPRGTVDPAAEWDRATPVAQEREAATPATRILAREILAVEVQREDEGRTLVIAARGQVPSGGFTDPQLLRVVYDEPPRDGIQDLVLLVTPPDGPAITVISEIGARHRWADFQQNASWLKGIRVHGAAAEGVVVMLDQ